jgi:hypothetical protein
MRLARLVGLLGLLVAVAACGLVGALSGDTVRGGWAWPRPAPLPPGATAVEIAVEEIPVVVNPDAEYGACPLALIPPFSISLQPADVPSVRYTSDDGTETLVVWPVGFSARVTDVLEIVAPDGTVVARAGVPVEGLGGGFWAGPNGREAAHVCMPQYGPKRVDATQP